MFNQFIKRIKSLTFFEIFICLTVIALVVFVVKYFGQRVDFKLIRVEVINKSWSENYNPYGYRTPFWLSEKLKIGQKEYNKSGQVIAEILNIENYERGSEEAEVYLTLRVRTTYQKKLRQHFFKEKPLDLGSAITLAPDQNVVYGQVIDNDIKDNGYPEKTFIITGRGRGVDRYLIDKIKTGESMNNRYTQKPVATILDFRTEKTSRIFVNQLVEANQTLSFKLNPNNQDIVVRLEVKASQIDGRWYFAGHQQIKVGAGIYFYGQNINLYGLEIENVQ